MFQEKESPFILRIAFHKYIEVLEKYGIRIRNLTDPNTPVRF